jgi:hypothetical protein
LALADGDQEDELFLHQRFAHLQHRREWFVLGKDLLALIEELQEQGDTETG